MIHTVIHSLVDPCPPFQFGTRSFRVEDFPHTFQPIAIDANQQSEPTLNLASSQIVTRS